MTKEYRVEIDALFIKDVVANSEAEAKVKIEQQLHFGDPLYNGAFFYELSDWKKLKIEEK